ncbi:hypothetical protein ACFL3P_01115 [Pseudomonadota bacterium]
MSKLSLTILLGTIILLHGCAFIGSQEYFSSHSENGEHDWRMREGARFSGETDSIKYSINEFIINVYSEEITSSTLTLGPCILIPLPIIPVFGIDESTNNEHININLEFFNSSENHSSDNIIVTKASIYIDDIILSPNTIYEHSPNNKNKINMPILLNSTKGRYEISYKHKNVNVNNYYLLLNIEDQKGNILLNDKISFKRDSSTFFGCVP